MCKLTVRREQEVAEADATAAGCVERAATWSNALWNKTYEGMGDNQEAAMYRAAQKYGVDPGTFWALRYRKPKAIFAHIFNRLQAAYAAEVERQEAKLRHEIEVTKKLPATPSRVALVAEAEALLGSNVEEEK